MPMSTSRATLGVALLLVTPSFLEAWGIHPFRGNTPASPAFLDAAGAPTTSLASAVSVANSSANNSGVGTVTADNQRDRQLQYSIRITF